MAKSSRRAIGWPTWRRGLGVSQHSLYEWIKERRLPAAERQAQVIQSEEVRRLKAELRRVTEERDILKKAAAYFAKQSG